MAYWFQSMGTSTTFYEWFVYWQNYAASVGTGIVAFNNVEVQGTLIGTGVATFKSTVYMDTYKQKIDTYKLDATDPPAVVTVHNRNAANFIKSKSTAVWFKFPVSNFHKTTDDRNIKLVYAHAGSGSNTVVFDAYYFVGSEDSGLSSTANGTASSSFTINNVPNELDSDSSLTIPNADISAATDWILVKLMRHPGYSADNASDFYLFDIEIT